MGTLKKVAFYSRLYISGCFNNNFSPPLWWLYFFLVRYHYYLRKTKTPLNLAKHDGFHLFQPPLFLWMFEGVSNISYTPVI